MTGHEDTGYELIEATTADVDAIVSLVNTAFEVEQFFKNVDRTDAAQISHMMKEGKFLILRDGNRLLASIYVKLNGERAYIGLLAIEPSHQKAGLGRRMMSEAEQHARAAGCSFADIRTINLRTELPPLYRKLGYVERGTEAVQPADAPKFTQPVHFVLMSKAL